MSAKRTFENYRRSSREAAIQSGYASLAVINMSPKKDEDSFRTPPKKKIIKKKRLSNSPTIPANYILMILPGDLLYQVFSFTVHENGVDWETFVSIQCTCKTFNTIINSQIMWMNVKDVKPSGVLNLDAFKIMSRKCQGTEGVCYHALRRGRNAPIALKKARVYRDNEGVPYYMMRELSALKKLSHPNICTLELINLHDFNLHLLFPYVEKTLHDILNPLGEQTINHHFSTTIHLEKDEILNIMSQLTSAMSYCHSRGILHRNLKPKHLLIIPGSGPKPLTNATVKVSDFALVRILSHPPRKYTSEVITLWYRPPEILMGVKNYTAAVDVWSMGCIFAEMIQGRPLFTGLCEIDQLFQIFNRLGTPNEMNWPDFEEMPNFQPKIFPKWDTSRLRGLLSNANELEFDFLNKCLVYNSVDRLSTAECLMHPYLKQHPQHQAAVDNYTADFMSNDSLFWHSDLINLNKTTLSQYSYLRELENTVLFSFADYSEAELRTRQESIEWIVDIMSIFESHMCLRTIYFAVQLFDRYVHYSKKMNSHRIISSSSNDNDIDILHYRLISATCLHIASKCEDVSYIGIKDLALAAQNEYEPRNILDMEEAILNSLNFDLFFPTRIDYINLFAECVSDICHNKPIDSLTRYLAEISLLYTNFSECKPSLVATAIAYYASYYQADGSPKGRGVRMPDALLKLTQYTQEEMLPYLKQIRAMQNQMLNANNSAIYNRYLETNLYEVALWLPIPESFL